MGMQQLPSDAGSGKKKRALQSSVASANPVLASHSSRRKGKNDKNCPPKACGVNGSELPKTAAAQRSTGKAASYQRKGEQHRAFAARRPELRRWQRQNTSGKRPAHSHLQRFLVSEKGRRLGRFHRNGRRRTIRRTGAQLHRSLRLPTKTTTLLASSGRYY
ncbi:hypothetical protein ERJ75_000866500 [Trypanosoma vivax]|nr:hypothetical protein ERJ75_000866500 [Trypanosoma vivax]